MVQQKDLGQETANFRLQARFHKNPICHFLIGRILHIPEVNRQLDSYDKIIRESEDKQGELALFLELVLTDLETDWELCDPAGTLQSLSRQNRPILLVSNHPLGGRDGLALLDCISQIWGSHHVKALVNEFLLTIPYLKEFFLPISPAKMESHRRMEQLRRLNTALEQNMECSKAYLFFPAGLCSRRHDEPLSLQAELKQSNMGSLSDDTNAVAEMSLLQNWQPLRQVYDLPWQSSFLRLGRKHRLPILPLHISGRNSNNFYRMARLRRKLGLRFNWEMLLLPGEFLHNRRRSEYQEKCRLKITPGALLELETISQWPSGYDRLWAQMCKHYVYQLPQWQNADMAQSNLADLDRQIRTLAQTAARKR
ncbi:hypothetical protein P0082_03835 [Candidatus Haliotispira prima]|uniref:Putative acyltransferase ACT14924-like acyltransferase domain-containing protein n=1 Tax=Candidatus Haliotispira prima TaxID=3034016 RepID=A0ABY8MK88_9SPIO|nr:hypothetical protein P0082_03835 [Candidatus Haliotispira prima]